MTDNIQRTTKTTRHIVGTTAIALSAAMTLAFTPTKASAFDVGGLIGTAMALQMGHYHGGNSGGGRSHAHVASRHDNDSGDDHSNDHRNSGVERDARDPAATLP